MLYPNWKKQIKEIITSLKKLGIYHNDFIYQNLLIYNGVLTLIDFGWADTKPNYPFLNITTELIDQVDKIEEIFQYLSLIKNREFFDKNLELVLKFQRGIRIIKFITTKTK